jgi:hypothetical protein
MVEEATVDAYGESEQATGWFTMIEQHLALPFETQVLGTTVTVTKIDRQAISILDLPLPSPRPNGSEWIEAYRHWRGRR